MSSQTSLIPRIRRKIKPRLAGVQQRVEQELRSRNHLPRELTAVGFSAVGASVVGKLLVPRKPFWDAIGDAGFLSVLAALAISQRTLLWTATSTNRQAKSLGEEREASKMEPSMQLTGDTQKVFANLEKLIKSRPNAVERSRDFAPGSWAKRNAEMQDLPVYALKPALEAKQLKNEAVVLVGSAREIQNQIAFLNSIGFTDVTSLPYDAPGHNRIQLSQFSIFIVDLSQVSAAKASGNLVSDLMNLDEIDISADFYTVGVSGSPEGLLAEICRYENVLIFADQDPEMAFSTIHLVRSFDHDER